MPSILAKNETNQSTIYKTIDLINLSSISIIPTTNPLFPTTNHIIPSTNPLKKEHLIPNIFNSSNWSNLKNLRK